MKKINLFRKTLISAFLCAFFMVNVLSQAPTNLKVRAYGQNELHLTWYEDANEAYQVETSLDSLSWTVVDTVANPSILVDGLESGTVYYVRVSAYNSGVVGDASAIEARTTTKRMVVDMPLDELVDDDKIKNILTDSLDVLQGGQVTLVDAENSGLGLPAVSFMGTETPAINSYFRLYNSTQGIDSAFTQRSVALWFKNESPGKESVLLSFGKRSGFDIVIKDGTLHGLTKVRTLDESRDQDNKKTGNYWWADSTGVEFSSNDWTHVTYVFDNPVTRIYVNGELADESDGIGYYHITGRDTILPWPNIIDMNEPDNTNGESAELGALFEPSAAMVQYLGDSWDNWARHGFNGLMSQLKMYNYALTSEEIKSMIAPAPENLLVQATGQNELILRWYEDESEKYQIELSSDSVLWNVIDTVESTSVVINDLDPLTRYFVRVSGMKSNIVGNASVIEARTTTKRLVVDMPLDELIDDDKIKNILTDSLDVLQGGQVALVDAENSGLGLPAVSFKGTETPAINSYFRLYNTTQGIDSAFTQRSVALWFKNESPGKESVLLSFGKRSGFDIVIKDGMLHGLTKVRTLYGKDQAGKKTGNYWWADSTGVEFSSNDWTHVTYVFDNPVTRIYLNGELADESDGIGYYQLIGKDTILPWPNIMDMNEPDNSNGESAELGALFEPSAAMVQYLGDTWDNGARHGFNGMMANIKMYNYALDVADIKAQYEENIVSMSKLDVWSHGVDNLTIAWKSVEGNTGYLIKQSEDGIDWSEIASLEANAITYDVTGLMPATEYFFKIEPQGVGPVTNNVTSGSTVTPGKIVHLDFAELIDGTGIKNIVTDSIDQGIEGNVNIDNIPETEIVTLDNDYGFRPNTSSIVFSSSETPPVTSYARLSKTLQPAGIGLNQRTITVWLKNNDPSKYSVPLSMGKRTGITFAYKDGKFHAFTKMRPTMGKPYPWYADSTGTELSSTDWTHITYIFDNPITKIYVNGELADESDGMFYNSDTDTLEILPFASGIAINEMTNTNGQSSEIGALFEPCAALVAFMDDTWDIGARNPFYGAMADLRFYNYALNEGEIEAVIMENLLTTAVTDKSYNFVSVYPNPAYDILYIYNASGSEVEVFDQVGRSMLKKSLENSDHINVSALPAGIYILKISDGTDKTVTRKISIVK